MLDSLPNELILFIAGFLSTVDALAFSHSAGASSKSHPPQGRCGESTWRQARHFLSAGCCWQQEHLQSPIHLILHLPFVNAILHQPS
jgi:hypothetical protein